MRVLVTGASGQLGSELAARLTAAGHEALPTAAHEGSGLPVLDITDGGGVAAALATHRPDAVANCAAWTKVDAAESEVDAAWRVNAIGPRLLADACARHDVHLLHVSTDFVFGEAPPGEPIHEWCEPSPRCVYGASKLAGEQEVRRLMRSHQVVRTSWLYGRQGPNFVLTMLRLAREQGALRVVADQIGSPTWTGDLAPALVRLLERGTPGTYHLTNAGSTSWHGLATAALRGAGLDVPIDRLSIDQWPASARRPAWSVLDNRAWRLLGETPLRPWREGLARYLDELI